ncbi:MAG: hypothetical protein H6R00_1795 [Proteobacteria bacterium]|nr:hypothetical protein [Pseudomonadota bacterium]
MKAVVRWREWDGEGLEHCVYQEDDDGLTLKGMVMTVREGLHGGHYLVRTDAAFRTRLVRVEYVDGPTVHVEADGDGHWRDLIANRPLPELEGCIDVDIRMTPATNTLPIKRLRLAQHESRDIAVAYVPLPDHMDDDLLPRRVEQRYTCLVPDRRYRYEGLASGFTAELLVDAAGLVVDYPGVFRRV